MTPADADAKAREILICLWPGSHPDDFEKSDVDPIAAALLAAVAEEREAIARFVEEDDCGKTGNQYHKPSDPRHVAGIAAAIRARGLAERPPVR